MQKILLFITLIGTQSVFGALQPNDAPVVCSTYKVKDPKHHATLIAAKPEQRGVVDRAWNGTQASVGRYEQKMRDGTTVVAVEGYTAVIPGRASSTFQVFPLACLLGADSTMRQKLHGAHVLFDLKTRFGQQEFAKHGQYPFPMPVRELKLHACVYDADVDLVVAPYESRQVGVNFYTLPAYVICDDQLRKVSEAEKQSLIQNSVNWRRP